MTRPNMTLDKLQDMINDLIDHNDNLSYSDCTVLKKMVNTRFEIYQQSHRDTIKQIIQELDKAENMDDDELRDLIYSIIDDYTGDIKQ